MERAVARRPTDATYLNSLGSALLVNVCIIMVPALLTLMMAFFVWDGVGVPVMVVEPVTQQ